MVNMKARTNFLVFVLVSSAVFFNAVSAQAQVKEHLFTGVGTVAGKNGSTSSLAASVGFSLAIPLGGKVFLRPVVTGGWVDPVSDNKPSFPSLQMVGLVGYKVTPVFSVLGGGGKTFLFPGNSSKVGLATIALSTSVKVANHVILFTPVAFNERNISSNVQLGYVW